MPSYYESGHRLGLLHSEAEPPSSFSPRAQLLELAHHTPRTLQGCFGEKEILSNPIRFSFFHPQNNLHPLERKFQDELTSRINRSPYARLTQNPNPEDVIFVSHHLENGLGTLEQRIKETPEPLGQVIRKTFAHPVLPANITAVIPLENFKEFSNLAYLDQVKIMRTAMIRYGSFRILFVDPEDQCAFGTMEGGCPITPDYQQLLERIVFMTAAKPVQPSPPERNIEPLSIWQSWPHLPTVKSIIEAGQKLGQRGDLDPPFDCHEVASSKRARAINGLLGWQRQSAGALAAWAIETDELLPSPYHLADYTGALAITGTGRAQADKTNLQPDQIGLLTLKGQTPCYLGRIASSVEGPELFSPLIDQDIIPPVRLSPHPRYPSTGFIYDRHGPITVPFVAAIGHFHRAVEEIRPVIINKQIIVPAEHVYPNFRLFSYPVGCGVETMVAYSREAPQRSIAITNLNTKILAVTIDVENHGTNILLLRVPYPGTDFIPRDPFLNLFFLLQNGCLRLSPDIPQI